MTRRTHHLRTPREPRKIHPHGDDMFGTDILIMMLAVMVLFWIVAGMVS